MPRLLLNSDAGIVEGSTIERIKTIVEAQRQTHDQQTLRTMLLADNYDARAVDLVLAQAYGLTVSPATAATTISPTTKVVLYAIATFFANAVVLMALITAFMALLSVIDSFDITILGFVLPIAVLVAGESGMVIYLRRNSPILARGLGWGIVITVSVIVLLALVFFGFLALLSTVDFR